MLAGVQEDIDTIDRMIADGESQYNKWRHPDPYIGKWQLNANFILIFGLNRIYIWSTI